MPALRLATLALAALLVACGEAEIAEAPPPIEVTDDATGHYCGMLLDTHDGPKGQIHLAGRDDPVWFSSVRDTVAFTRLPEEPKDILAIYVNDMGRATDWARPEPGTWIEAEAAWFVIGSGRRGGMGAPEAVPFGSEEAASGFAAEHGGEIARLADIPDDYVLGTTDVELAPADHHHQGH
jgi:copper chaperone NosL